MNGRIISIDPGLKKGLGVAAFYADGPLFSAGMYSIEYALGIIERDKDFHCNGSKPLTVVVEQPRTYGGRASRGDANDLIAIARVVGRIEEACSRSGAVFRAVEPKAWKGTLPKEVCFHRVWRTLDVPERAACRIPARARALLEQGRPLGKSVAGDVLDAVGIGLCANGRLHRRLPGRLEAV